MIEFRETNLLRNARQCFSHIIPTRALSGYWSRAVYKLNCVCCYFWFILLILFNNTRKFCTRSIPPLPHLRVEEPGDSPPPWEGNTISWLPRCPNNKEIYHSNVLIVVGRFWLLLCKITSLVDTVYDRSEHWFDWQWPSEWQPWQPSLALKEQFWVVVGHSRKHEHANWQC